MKIPKSLQASIFILSLAFSSHASSSETIGEMLRFCERPEGDILKTHCYSYTGGIIDVQNAWKLTEGASGDYKIETCFPDGVTASQGAKIFVKWAEDNPHMHHVDASTGIIISLAVTFPCSSDK